MSRTVSTLQRSRWIPWVYVGGMAVVIVVNAVMVTAALQSWSGLVVARPFERGLHYNEMLAAQQRQDALGWTVRIEYLPDPAPLQGRIAVTALDRTGQSLPALAVSGYLVRPIEALPSLPLNFQSVDDGQKNQAQAEASISPPKPGQWEARITVQSGEDRFIATSRVIVP
jgi:nitrogen fixation protein FixH